ncbi:coiled-coil domain-containing protein 201 [Lemur catta]|uniref:coiled-coil domain-containing protein 201 n=1 Tax=Lemur catta TaxID=9447 RepID=UPI001E267570|nr:coiled-coil domain-containing protein 201 [Lemur catta]
MHRKLQCSSTVLPFYVAPGSSSSEEDSPPLLIKRAPLRKSLKHSTPEETAPGRSPRPSGGASLLSGSPVLAYFSQDLVSQLVGVSPQATFRKRRLSTIRASKVSGGQPGPDSDLSAPGEEPLAAASLVQEEQQRQQQQQQKGESLPANSWRLSHSGLPGIPNAARRKRRDRKKQAAEMERVRQWEIRLLQNIEEAVQHELTIDD